MLPRHRISFAVGKLRYLHKVIDMAPEWMFHSDLTPLMPRTSLRYDSPNGLDPAELSVA